MNWMSACVTPMKPRMKLRNTAARMISMIIAVVRIVPSKASRNIVQLSVPYSTLAKHAARIHTPTDAASVGVAIPA